MNRNMLEKRQLIFVVCTLVHTAHLFMISSDMCGNVIKHVKFTLIVQQQAGQKMRTPMTKG